MRYAKSNFKRKPQEGSVGAVARLTS